MRCSTTLLSLAVIASAATSAHAQEADDNDAPTVIREHGTAPPSGSPARAKAAAPAPKGGPVKKPADTRLEVKVHEGQAPDETDVDDTEPSGRRSDEPLGTAPNAAPEPEIDFASRTAAEPRTALPELEPSALGEWQRHGEIGASVAWLARPFAAALGARPMTYSPAVGVGLHVQWDIRRWLLVKPYFLFAAHDVELRYGALSTASPSSIRSDTVFGAVQAKTFSFGAKVLPTANLTPRVRVWALAGVGYGRAGFHGLSFTEPGGKPVIAPDRDGVFVEFPIGVGGSFELLKGRAALVYEATVAPAIGHSGSAYEATSIVDNDGRLRELGAFGAFEASFVQTLGLSFLL